MDMQVVSALAGTLVGVTATAAIAWFNQKMLTRRELIRDEFRMRQTLYGEFIAECKTLLWMRFSIRWRSPTHSYPCTR